MLKCSIERLYMTDIMYVPFPKKLYDDLVRFSNGRCNPAEWAVDRLEDWIDRNFQSELMGMGWASDHFMDLFSDRIADFAEEYSPDLLEYWAKLDEHRTKERLGGRHPLIWKGVEVAPGSDVRMSYGGVQHYAKIHHGKIVDADGDFSPSEWASKVAGGTSRNAWRDLWFKAPGEIIWVPALALKERFLKSIDIQL